MSKPSYIHATRPGAPHDGVRVHVGRKTFMCKPFAGNADGWLVFWEQSAIDREVGYKTIRRKHIIEVARRHVAQLASQPITQLKEKEAHHAED